MGFRGVCSCGREIKKGPLPWMRAPVSGSRVGGLVTCLQLQQVPLRDSVSHGQACTHAKRQNSV